MILRRQNRIHRQSLLLVVALFQTHVSAGYDFNSDFGSGIQPDDYNIALQLQPENPKQIARSLASSSELAYQPEDEEKIASKQSTILEDLGQSTLSPSSDSTMSDDDIQFDALTNASDAPSDLSADSIINASLREDLVSYVSVFTDRPTVSPKPTVAPTTSLMPSSRPSDMPSQVPTVTVAPSDLPSSVPSDNPSLVPTVSPRPSMSPSVAPSDMPSSNPSLSPSVLPSAQPSARPSPVPSAMPSISPTLTCHDEPLYRSPINGLQCRDHEGTSCLQWRYLGLTLDDLEELILNCPVSCNIDCGAMTRFDITVSYQISRVPGLLDAQTAEDLNDLTKTYLIDYLRVQEPFLVFFVDHVELLSQSTINKGAKKKKTRRRDLAETFVNLWVGVAIRGFAFNITQQETTEILVSGIDSLGYSNAIQNSGNPYLQEAYAFSAAEKAEKGVAPISDDVTDDESSVSAPIVVMVIVFMGIAAFAITAYIYHKRSPKGLPCCRFFRRQKSVAHERDNVHSPESVNVLSQVGSMFSFDDTATAGTNGLMRFIGSFSRSKDSTSPSSSGSAVQSPSHEDIGNNQPYDEELGRITPTNSDVIEEPTGTEEEEEEPHPLTGLIPPMIVYDNIDEDESEELDVYRASDRSSQEKTRRTERSTSVVPSRRVEASSSFKTAIGNRQRPSATNDLAEYLSETSDFVTDPSMLRWTKLDSRRPSPIGIVMDSDGDDDASVASTPVRLQETSEAVTGNGTSSLRRTKSLDDCSILESVSDIMLTDQDYASAVSPIDIPRLGIGLPSPSRALHRPRPMASLPLMANEGPSRGKNNSPDMAAEEPVPFTWVRRGRHSASPESPTMKGSSHSQFTRTRPLLAEPRNSFWNRSPIAKGVKDAIWSTKRVGTPTKSETIVKRNSGNSNNITPTRTDLPVRRGTSFNVAAPATPTRHEVEPRRMSLTGQASTPTRGEGGLIRKSSMNLPRPSTPSANRTVTPPRRSSTPTRLESFARRVPTPTKGDPMPRRSSSPTGTPMKSNSEESQSDGRRSSRSGSFSGDELRDEEIQFFEFRAPRFGKLGLVINSTPQTGPMVEQVKDYSTLFGRINAGDRIVEVDGAETSHMTIKEVTKRLAGKYGIRAVSSEVRIKVARVHEREWYDGTSMHSEGSMKSLDSFSSNHRRNHSDPEPLLNRLSFTGGSEHHRISSYSYSNHSKSGEEV